MKSYSPKKEFHRTIVMRKNMLEEKGKGVHQLFMDESIIYPFSLSFCSVRCTEADADVAVVNGGGVSMCV